MGREVVVTVTASLGPTIAKPDTELFKEDNTVVPFIFNEPVIEYAVTPCVT